MTTRMVVQGTPVAQPAAAAFETTTARPVPSAPQENHKREDKVETKCNDPIFAICYCHCYSGQHCTYPTLSMQSHRLLPSHPAKLFVFLGVFPTPSDGICRVDDDEAPMMTNTDREDDGRQMNGGVLPPIFATKKDGLQMLRNVFDFKSLTPYLSPFAELLGWDIELYSPSCILPSDSPVYATF